jgi:hypothetical protein
MKLKKSIKPIKSKKSTKSTKSKRRYLSWVAVIWVGTDNQDCVADNGLLSTDATAMPDRMNGMDGMEWTEVRD